MLSFSAASSCHYVKSSSVAGPSSRIHLLLIFSPIPNSVTASVIYIRYIDRKCGESNNHGNSVLYSVVGSPKYVPYVKAYSPKVVAVDLLDVLDVLNCYHRVAKNKQVVFALVICYALVFDGGEGARRDSAHHKRR